jgi:hypothetical protein
MVLGAPSGLWLKRLQRYGYLKAGVGNGGISLRNVSVMKQIASKYGVNIPPYALIVLNKILDNRIESTNSAFSYGNKASHLEPTGNFTSFLGFIRSTNIIDKDAILNTPIRREEYEFAYDSLLKEANNHRKGKGDGSNEDMFFVINIEKSKDLSTSLPHRDMAYQFAMEMVCPDIETRLLKDKTTSNITILLLSLNYAILIPKYKL